VSDLRDENTLPHPHQMRTNVGGKKMMAEDKEEKKPWWPYDHFSTFFW